MAVASTVLFDRPQQEVASLIRDQLDKCERAEIIAGFVTIDGIKILEAGIRGNPAKLATVIVGAGTYRAYEAFDELVTMGVSIDRLFVHLGHTKLTGSSAKHRFYRYHPMLHSKIYYMEHNDGTSCAIIGSHNVTNFALSGLNGEAAVMLEGPKQFDQFAEIRAHIKEARAQSVSYSPGMKEAYSWWTFQFMEGMRAKANDLPRDGEYARTFVIFAEAKTGLPKKGEIIYFELPAAIGQISTLNAEVHIYIFDSLPSSPWAALNSIDVARTSIWCRTLGLELDQGAKELTADWQIVDPRSPSLTSTPTPFRPRPGADRQQVRVQAYNEVRGEFEYLFKPTRAKWIPIIAEGASIRAGPDEIGVLAKLDLIPPEDGQWGLVENLVPEDSSPQDDARAQALLELSPDAGSFVMMSMWRRMRNG